MSTKSSQLFAKPFLGFTVPNQSPFAFHAPAVKAPDQPCVHEGNSHILTIGATGAGKTNLMIANLLAYSGSVIVVDIRGDATIATEPFRRMVLHQPTYIVDPFRVTGLTRVSDRLDPHDIMKLPHAEVESESQTIATTLAASHQFSRDPFWHTEAANLVAGNLAYNFTQPDPAQRTMNTLVEALFSDDVAYGQAVLLDTKIPKNSFAYSSIAAFLQLPDNNAGTRASVLSTAHTMLFPFRSPAIRSCMGPSTVDLNALYRGQDMSIYLCLPLERLASHGVTLTLWLDLLLQVLIRRQTPPAVPTLILVDEAAQLGYSPALKIISTYLRATGCRLWTFWQDLSQIQSTYEREWQTLVNNTSALTFLPGNPLAARSLADLAGIPASMISNLSLNEQLVAETAQLPRVVRMAQYWRDAPFVRRYTPIPRYDKVVARRT